MEGKSSFVGLKVNGKVVTNRQAVKYLQGVFRVTIHASAEAAGVPEKDILFLSEAEARARHEWAGPGDGYVMSIYDIGSGVDHVVKRVLVVGHDEFFDASKADEPVDAAHFFTVLAAIEHENQHLRQHTLLEKDGTALGKLFFLNQWGLYGSQSLEREMYAIDVNEIDAQYVAMDHLAGRVDRMGSVELVGMSREDGKLVEVDGESVKSGWLRRPRDIVLPFYQERRHEGVKDDFVPYPDGGYKSAGKLLGEYRKSFMDAVLEPKEWDAAAVPDAHMYENIDAYAGDGDRAVAGERLARMFRDNPKHFERYKAETCGYRQAVMLGCMSTRGAGDKSLSEILEGRILADYGVDVSPKAAFAPPGLAEGLPGAANPRYLMAVRALGRMRSDAARSLEGDGPEPWG